MKYVAIVERPDSSTYTQEIERKGTLQESVKTFQNETLGYPYGWRTVNGKKMKYVKSNAYLVVDAYVVQ